MEPYQELEEQYAAFVGAAHAVSCSSGTAALHLALLTLDIGPGDEVILPDFTMAACGFAISYTGATPVFADVHEDDYSIDPVAIEKLITPRTKAVMAVHVYGRLAPVQRIVALCRPRGIAVIEDACEAHGAVKGSDADLTCYSFYRNKIIHAEEGGIITTESAQHASRMRYLKNMAFSPEHDYFHKDIGYNYRIPDAEAALALHSLDAYEANAAKRRAIESWYDKYLAHPMPKRDAVWFYEALVPEKAKAAILAEVPAARHSFKPLSSFPMYGAGTGSPVAAKLARLLILLPASPQLSEADVKEVATAVNAHAAAVAT